MSNEPTVVRFSVKQRIEHFSVMVLFTLLVLTGFPQKWPTSDWSAWIAGFFGGVEQARVIHRWCGVLFAVVTVIHLASAVFLVVSKKALPTLIPNRQDFRDAIQTLRYYMGLEETQASFDRFDYRQKFEYWGMVMGGALMVVTGFMLLFPIVATQFLPGEFIPVAKTAHSNEGLLAFLVVITWHIFNAHFSPEAFPFDKSIFTGRVTVHKVKHEHPLEWERIQTRAAGRKGGSTGGDTPKSREPEVAGAER